MNLYNLFKKIAFQIDPEMAHNQSMALLSKFPESVAMLLGAQDGELKGHSENNFDFSITLKDGNKWQFPVGLAAGLDKNAEAIGFFSAIPFGAIEVGTVTPLPQEGNPKPRMFRLVEEESLLNRMGFNNGGMDAVEENLKKANKRGKVLGINLGKNKITPQEDAPSDYRKLYEKFAPLADYLVINVSSPNTPGLRDLQNIESLKVIFEALTEIKESLPCPLYLKISPDLALDDLAPIVQLANDFKLAGIIATNTTIREDIGQGGVSGKLLHEKAQKVREELLRIMGHDSNLELIGVGGISCYDDVVNFWKSGGRVCQIYTSFIYQGPQILLNMRRGIEEDLKAKNLTSVNQLIENYYQENKVGQSK